MEVDEVGGRWTFSRANEGYTSCGPVVEMSWHRAGVLLLGAQSCLPVPGVPAVGGIGSVLLSMARMGWKLCHVFRLYTVVHLWVCLVEYGGCTQSCSIFPKPRRGVPGG
uniref:Transposon protein, putative, unclassified n=1 Tax=Oryza sativa subsp. japonica TaxID=39947 RepID=Q338T5_ORYSJ|nr:transposon protein, putative, unclassified [Oryza sativa Japonica Group]